MKNSKKELLLSTLLSCPTIKEAAAAAGVPESTVYAWLKKEDFSKEYERRKRQLVEDATNLLQINLSAAVQTVIDIMDSPYAPHQTRLNAARTVQEFYHKYAEQNDIISRLEALEAMANADNKR